MKRVFSIVLCLLIVLQAVSFGAIFTSAAQAPTVTYEQNFSENPFSAQEKTIFTVEHPFTAGGSEGNQGWGDATAPTVQNDGSLLFDQYDAIAFYWQNLDGFSADASKTYTITFDVNILSMGDGTDIMPRRGWNRELYFAPGGWFNQVEFKSSAGGGIRAGGTDGTWNSSDYQPGDYSVTVVWNPADTTIKSTVKRGTTVISEGTRTNDSYVVTNANFTLWAWRCEGGSFKLSNLTLSNGDTTYTADFSTDFKASDTDAKDLWTVESVRKTDATMPTVEGGVMKLQTKNSAAFHWINVPNVGAFDATNNIYTFEFDARVTNVGNGHYWGGDDQKHHTRVLYVGFGGWYDQIQLMTQDSGVKAGDTAASYSRDSYLNKFVHVSLVWDGTMVSSTITDSTGKVLATGIRTNTSYASSSDADMKSLVFRCEDGGIDIDNVKFSKAPVTKASTKSINIPNNKQAVYEAQLNYTGSGKLTVKLGSNELFSVSPSNMVVGQKVVQGSYGTGVYKIKVYVNTAQKMVSVEIVKPDNGVVRRALAKLLGGNTIDVYANSADAVVSESLTYVDITQNAFEIINSEPSASGFSANVYNIVTSFDNACTTRNFAWTAKASYIIDSEKMAVKYRVSGTSNWTVVEAVKEIETTQVADEDYFKCDVVGLTPNTTYEYQIGKKSSTASSDWSKTYTFKTSSKDVNDFTFVAVGDTQGITWGGEVVDQKGFKYAQTAITEAFQEINDPAFILHTGDVVETGGDKQMWNWYFKALGEYGATTPHFAAIGNHDAATTQLFFDYHFNHPNNGGTAALDKNIAKKVTRDDSKHLVANADETIYSYNYGNAHFIVLNSGNYSSDDEWIIEAQREWLIADLEANTCAKWTIITVHEPVYHRLTNPFESRPWLYDVIESHNVDLVIQGHSHLVTRTYPMKNGEIVSKSYTDTIPQGTGTVYTTIGSTALNKDGNSESINVEEIFSMSVPDMHAPTYTSVRVTGDKIEVVTKQVDGLVLDTFTITSNDSKELVHAKETLNAKPATCIEDGYSGDIVCAGCGEVFQTGSVLPKTPDVHREKLVGATSASCGDAGYTGDKICKDCGKTVEKGTVIEATGAHIFGDWEIVKEATDDEPGEKTRRCSACAHIEREEIPKLKADVENSDTTENTGKKKGCRSSISAGAVVATTLLMGASFSRKKKKYE